MLMEYHQHYGLSGSKNRTSHANLRLPHLQTDILLRPSISNCCTIATPQSFRNHLKPDGFPPTRLGAKLGAFSRDGDCVIVLLRSRMATTIATSIFENC